MLKPLMHNKHGCSPGGNHTTRKHCTFLCCNSSIESRVVRTQQSIVLYRSYLIG